MTLSIIIFTVYHVHFVEFEFKMNSKFYLKYRCGTCLEILKKKKPAISSDCMHRFCKTCFERSVRISKTGCPVCRVPIGTRRKLKDNPLYDDLQKQANNQMQGNGSNHKNVESINNNSNLIFLVHVYLHPTLKSTRSRMFHLMFYMDSLQDVVGEQIIVFTSILMKFIFIYYCHLISVDHLKEFLQTKILQIVNI